MPHILKSCDITQLVVPICYLIFEARRDISKVRIRINTVGVRGWGLPVRSS